MRVSRFDALFVAVSLFPVSVPALASPVTAATESVRPVFVAKAKGAKDRGLTPERAEQQRQARRSELGSDPSPAALEEAAVELGDPVLFLDAAEAYLAAARSDRDQLLAERAKEPAFAAQDILYFLQNETGGSWRPVATGDLSRLIDRAQKIVRDVDDLVTEIEKEQAAAAVASKDAPEPKKERRKARPGTGLIAAGSVFTVVGAGGLAMIGAGVALSARKQDEVEAADPTDQATIDRIDSEGKRANVIAYAGIGVAAVGLATGIALIAVGAKKRRAAGTPDEHARLHVGPAFWRAGAGVAVGGRF